MGWDDTLNWNSLIHLQNYSTSGGEKQEPSALTASPYTLDVVFEKNLAPVLRPGSLEIGSVMPGLDGGVNAHFPGHAKWVHPFERRCRRVVKRTAGVGNQDDVPGRIGSGCDRVVDIGGIVKIG